MRLIALPTPAAIQPAWVTTGYNRSSVFYHTCAVSHTHVMDLYSMAHCNCYRSCIAIVTARTRQPTPIVADSGPSAVVHEEHSTYFIALEVNIISRQSK